MSMRSRWDLNWRGDQIASTVEAASVDALREAGRAAVEDIREDTPFRSGALYRSGRVDVFQKHAVVSFGQSGKSDRGRPTRHYAIPNETRKHYQHTRGEYGFFRKNFLPRKVFAVMAARIRRALKG